MMTEKDQKIMKALEKIKGRKKIAGAFPSPFVIVYIINS
jgi:hypothetical protein